MRRKTLHNLLLLTLLSAFFISLGIEKIEHRAMLSRLHPKTVTLDSFREQQLNESMLSYLHKSQSRGVDVGLYLLESGFGKGKFSYPYEKRSFEKLRSKWQTQKNWSSYIYENNAIWNDVKYFPIPQSTIDKRAGINYENGWMTERNYGGKRGHEGTDIMTKQNLPGVYPVVSITDGIVTKLGWLEKGGYRVGITSPSGGYFYYAHLDSYSNIKEGDKVRAGQLLGFVGDTGYGPEGTRGKFSVHLHLGIYIYPDGKEQSINPYWILRFLETYQLKYAYSVQ